MSKPIGFSKQEIESCILAGFTQYEEDKKRFQSMLGTSDDLAFMGATWKRMSPDARGFLKKSQPEVFRQAVSLFGE